MVELYTQISIRFGCIVVGGMEALREALWLWCVEICCICCLHFEFVALLWKFIRMYCIAACTDRQTVYECHDVNVWLEIMFFIVKTLFSFVLSCQCFTNLWWNISHSNAAHGCWAMMMMMIAHRNTRIHATNNHHNIKNMVEEGYITSFDWKLWGVQHS